MEEEEVVTVEAMDIMATEGMVYKDFKNMILIAFDC